MKNKPKEEIQDILKLEKSIPHKKDGSIIWRFPDGTVHRKFGPALESADGSKYWYLNGKLHREDGPAIEGTNGKKHWFLNGKRHRENGPAVENPNGTRVWWINGQF